MDQIQIDVIQIDAIQMNEIQMDVLNPNGSTQPINGMIIDMFQHFAFGCHLNAFMGFLRFPNSNLSIGMDLMQIKMHQIIMHQILMHQIQRHQIQTKMHQKKYT